MLTLHMQASVDNQMDFTLAFIKLQHDKQRSSAYLEGVIYTSVLITTISLGHWTPDKSSTYQWWGHTPTCIILKTLINILLPKLFKQNALISNLTWSYSLALHLTFYLVLLRCLCLYKIHQNTPQNKYSSRPTMTAHLWWPSIKLKGKSN
jgi:hypothetical protein